MYRILDDGLCVQHTIATEDGAKQLAETYINQIPFGELGTVQIINDDDQEIVAEFEPVIIWQ